MMRKIFRTRSFKCNMKSDLEQLGKRQDNTSHEDHQIFSDHHLQFANCHSGPFFLQKIGSDHVFAKVLNCLLGSFFLIFQIV